MTASARSPSSPASWFRSAPPAGAVAARPFTPTPTTGAYRPVSVLQTAGHVQRTARFAARVAPGNPSRRRGVCRIATKGQRDGEQRDRCAYDGGRVPRVVVVG